MSCVDEAQRLCENSGDAGARVFVVFGAVCVKKHFSGGSGSTTQLFTFYLCFSASLLLGQIFIESLAYRPGASERRYELFTWLTDLFVSKSATDLALAADVAY